MLGCATPAFAQDEVTLSFWHNHPEWKDRVQAIVDVFEAEHPGIKVAIEQIPGPQFAPRLNTALAAGEAPDIIATRPGPEIAANVKAGYLTDLTGTVDVDTLTPSALAASQYEDRVYAVPIMGNYTVGLYYNRDIFEQAGAVPPTTTDELLALCDDLRAKGIEPMIAPAQDGAIPGFLYMLIASSRLGVDGVAALRSGERKLTDPDLVEAAAFLKTLHDRCFAEGSLGTSYVEGKAMFALGRGAMMEGGSADYAGFTETNPSVNLSVVPWPPLPGGTGSTVTGMQNIFGVNARSTHQEAAATFLDWMLGDRPAQMVADTITLSTNKNISPSDNRVMQEMVAASRSNDVRVWFEYPEIGRVFSTVGLNAQALFLGELSPEDFSAALQAVVEPTAN
jgi:raffinose/stachyose/melibiose transport system substrate-binding protein